MKVRKIRNRRRSPRYKRTKMIQACLKRFEKTVIETMEQFGVFDESLTNPPSAS